MVFPRSGPDRFGAPCVLRPKSQTDPQSEFASSTPTVSHLSCLLTRSLATPWPFLLKDGTKSVNDLDKWTMCHLNLLYNSSRAYICLTRILLSKITVLRTTTRQAQQ
jgi:hypothetical protein